MEFRFFVYGPRSIVSTSSFSLKSDFFFNLHADWKDEVCIFGELRFQCRDEMKKLAQSGTLGASSSRFEVKNQSISSRSPEQLKPSDQNFVGASENCRNFKFGD